jgi:hypothetical protein
MGAEAVMAIAVTEARTACKGEPNIEQRIKKAMRACHGHWMVTNEVQQLNSALAAAALESPIVDEKNRILRSGSALNKLNYALNAAVSGVPVDFTRLVDEIPKEDDRLPLIDWWNETKKGV